MVNAAQSAPQRWRAGSACQRMRRGAVVSSIDVGRAAWLAGVDLDLGLQAGERFIQQARAFQRVPVCGMMRAADERTRACW